MPFNKTSLTSPKISKTRKNLKAMRVLSTVSAMQAYARAIQQEGQSLVFVPTLGGLHEGHLALIRKGKTVGDVLVVSLFLNPTQFNAQEDLDNYPANLEDDLQSCKAEGVDCVFTPDVTEMYPPGDEPLRKVGPLAQHLCGAKRGDHFRGVVTIVAKLFAAVQPTHAIFGEKDYQQLQIIRQLVADLKLKIKIIAHPIVREANGLALSSRNRRLNPEEKTEALCLVQALRHIQSAYESGERDPKKLIALAQETLQKSPHAKIDYIEIVDATTLQPLTTLQVPALCALAVYFGPVRLIDNCFLP
jgi:pantoate--beta-alanine ligase